MRCRVGAMAILLSKAVMVLLLQATLGEEEPLVGTLSSSKEATHNREGTPRSIKEAIPSKEAMHHSRAAIPLQEAVTGIQVCLVAFSTRKVLKIAAVTPL